MISPKKSAVRQVEEKVVTDGITELAGLVSALGDLAKSTPKRRAEGKSKSAPKAKKAKK